MRMEKALLVLMSAFFLYIGLVGLIQNTMSQIEAVVVISLGIVYLVLAVKRR